MLASVIIGHVRDIYNDKDASSYRIADATIIACINQARRQVVKAIPSRFRTLRSVKLVAGALQTVPDDCAYNFGPTRNMGEDGATAGAVIRVADRKAQDAIAPAWRGTTGTVVKEAYIDDPRGATYEVNPAIPSTPEVHIELAMAAFPADLTGPGDDIGMSDQFEMALTYWALSIIYGMETEEASQVRVDSYKRLFAEELGVGAS